MSELPSTLLVMALAAESDGVFEGAGVSVVYTGVGKVNATLVLSQWLARYASAGRPLPAVVNFGSVGSHRYPTGTLVGCHEFVQRDMDVRALGFALGETPYEGTPLRLSFPNAFPELPVAVCGSGDSFSTAAPELACDVVDMEAYALAKVCWLAGAPFSCAKYVTDGADHAAAGHWRDNVHKAADAFLRLYEQLR